MKWPPARRPFPRLYWSGLPVVPDTLDADDTGAAGIHPPPVVAIVLLVAHADDAALAVEEADVVVALPLQQLPHLTVAQAVLASADMDTATTEAEMQVDGCRWRSLRRNGHCAESCAAKGQRDDCRSED